MTPWGPRMKLVAGNSNPKLAEAIAASLDMPLTKAQEIGRAHV